MEELSDKREVLRKGEEIGRRWGVGWMKSSLPVHGREKVKMEDGGDGEARKGKRET